MKRLLLPLLTSAIVLSSCLTARSFGSDTAQVAKKAVALLHVQRGPQDGFDIGSAFCVSRAGFFVTTNQVALRMGGMIQIVTAANTPDEQRLYPQVIRRDPQHNLALLQVSPPPARLAALELAESPDVRAGAEITTFDQMLRSEYRENPPFSSPALRITHVTSVLDNPASGLKKYFCNADLTGGGCGAPVLDSEGRVIGIVEAASFGPNHGATITPAEFIRGLLAEPIITVTPGEFASRYKPADIQVSVLSAAAHSNYEVEFSLGPPGEPPQVVTSPLSGDACTFKLAPCRPARGKLRTLIAQFEKGTVHGEVADQPIQIGDRPVPLSDIRQIEHVGAGDECLITPTAGDTQKGKVTGLNAVPVDLGEITVTLDLSRAHSIVFEEREIHSVAYGVVVRSQGKTIATSKGTIPLLDEGRADRPPQPAETAAALEALPMIDGQPTHTALAGGPGGNPMEAISKAPHDVVGFQYRLSMWNNAGIIRDFLPMYIRPPEVQQGQIVAKPGYVVGGLLVDSDLYAHAARVIFMRKKGDTLDPADTYLSDWIGTPSSGLPPKRLAGTGAHVVGVCGRKGINMDALGLVVMR